MLNKGMNMQFIYGLIILIMLSGCQFNDPIVEEFNANRDNLITVLNMETDATALEKTIQDSEKYYKIDDTEFQQSLEQAGYRLLDLKRDIRTSQILVALASGTPETELDRYESMYKELVQLNPNNSEYNTKLQEYRTKAEEARNQRRLKNLWTYLTDSDEMTGKRTHHAIILSSNVIQMGFPYNDPQRGELSLRNHPRYGVNVIFSVTEGQIRCNSYDSCIILVRFDDGQPVRWSANGPSDNSSNVIFLQNEPDFRRRLQRAKTIRLEVPFYQEGNQIFRFEVGGFDVAMW